jgi:hypothetical protein
MLNMYNKSGAFEAFCSQIYEKIVVSTEFPLILSRQSLPQKVFAPTTYFATYAGVCTQKHM